ncbi:MAG TPA: hypothetical protein VHN13_03680 [Candidatus Tectomicrobia bacterium]|jgi:hypothetical protein|nr:hypothetical protein [Candidatus Tectomicrobia bacterium]
MAKVYYVKDGSYPQNFVDLGRRVPLDELERRLQDRDLRYLSTCRPSSTPRSRRTRRGMWWSSSRWTSRQGNS